MSKVEFTPPLCGCSDRSAYVRAEYGCEQCGNVCKSCLTPCKKSNHKFRKLNADETGTQSDWIKTFGYPS